MSSAADRQRLHRQRQRPGRDGAAHRVRRHCPRHAMLVVAGSATRPTRTTSRRLPLRWGVAGRVAHRSGPARGGAGIAVTHNAAPPPRFNPIETWIGARHGASSAINERVEQNLRLTEFAQIAKFLMLGGTVGHAAMLAGIRRPASGRVVDALKAAVSAVDWAAAPNGAANCGLPPRGRRLCAIIGWHRSAFSIGCLPAE